MSRAMSTSEESEPCAHRNGTNVTSSVGIASTRTGIRPVSGIRLVTPSPGSSVFAGSISITISNSGCIADPGISALADFSSALSASPSSVGIEVADPGMSTMWISTPST